MTAFDEIMRAADELSRELRPLYERRPWGQAWHVLDPTRYARANYEAYVRRAADGPRAGVIVGMNPGPHGMAQTGVPFGDVTSADQILGRDLVAPADRPTVVLAGDRPAWRCCGLEYHRDEVSGRRLWGELSRLAGTIGRALGRVFVVNHYPLLLLGAGGQNVPSSDLPRTDPRTTQARAACDLHLRRVAEAVGATRVLALGRHAEAACRRALAGSAAEVRETLHPSPRNAGWADAAAPALAWVLGGAA